MGPNKHLKNVSATKAQRSVTVAVLIPGRRCSDQSHQGLRRSSSNAAHPVLLWPMSWLPAFSQDRALIFSPGQIKDMCNRNVVTDFGTDNDLAYHGLYHLDIIVQVRTDAEQRVAFGKHQSGEQRMRVAAVAQQLERMRRPAPETRSTAKRGRGCRGRHSEPAFVKLRSCSSVSRSRSRRLIPGSTSSSL